MQKKALENLERVKRAKALLVSCLGDKPLRTVQSLSDSPAKMREKLEEIFATKSSASRIMFMSCLFTYKYFPGNDMGDHIDELDSMMNKLSAMGTKIAEELRVAILLTSLSDEKDLEIVVAALKTKEELTWNGVCARLCDEPSQRRRRSGSIKDAKLLSSAAGNNEGTHSKSKETRKCYNCKKRGNLIDDCTWKKKKFKSNNKNGEQMDEMMKLVFALLNHNTSKEYNF